MYTIEIPYENYLGIKKVKQARFNLTETELQNMHFAKEGLITYIERLAIEKDHAEIIKMLGELVDLAYGEMSDDGEYFRKSETILNEFKAHPAYNVLMQKLLVEDGAASDLLYGAVPAKLREPAKKKAAEESARISAMMAASGAEA